MTFKAPVGNAGAVIAIVGMLLQREKLRIPFPIWIFGSFLLWAFISSFASPYTDLVLDNIFEQLKLFMIMIVVVNALRTEGQLRFYLMFFLGCFVLFPVRGTLVGGDRIQGRAVWNFIYANPNDLATLCLLALGMALAVMFFAPRRPVVRLGAAVSALALIVVMFLSESRGAFIGLMAGMGWGLGRLGLKRPILTLLLGGVVALVLSMTIPPAVWERLSGIEKLTSTSTIAEADPEGSAEERFEIQQTAWRIFVGHPIFGVGFGMYRQVNAKYAPSLGEKDTHNTYLNLAAETGLPGLILWISLVVSVLLFAYRVRKQAAPDEVAEPQAWVERALFGYLVAAMFGTYVKLSFPYIMLGILWCWAKLKQSEPELLGEAKESRACAA
ncbi:MAG TPA: O-antigen ligase family protein [Rhodocyclaceae bacterium]|nr:O-antigen ligase family protein [Rhodocyclaceae bacterium]